MCTSCRQKQAKYYHDVEQAKPHIELVTINVNGWDDYPTLMCKREKCRVPNPDGPHPAYTHWSVDIYGKTPEEVVELRDQHLKENP